MQEKSLEMRPLVVDLQKLFSYTVELGESQVAVNEELIHSSHSFLMFEDLCFLSSFCEMIIERFDYY